MVTIGKLGKGQESYYLNSVATGAEDYYAAEGEAPGQWTGAGAADLDLCGEVERDQLRAVLAGLHRETGGQLPRFLRSDRMPGFAPERSGWQERGLLDELVQRWGRPVTVFTLRE